MPLNGRRASSRTILIAVLVTPLGTILAGLGMLAVHTVIQTKDATQQNALDIELLQTQHDSQDHALIETAKEIEERLDQLEREAAELRATRFFFKRSQTIEERR